MSKSPLVKQNSVEDLMCKVYGHCSGETQRKKMQEITLFGLALFSSCSKKQENGLI